MGKPYIWVKKPLGHRARENARQTKLLKDAWKDTGKPSVVIDNTLDRQFEVR